MAYTGATTQVFPPRGSIFDPLWRNLAEWRNVAERGGALMLTSLFVMWYGNRQDQPHSANMTIPPNRQPPLRGLAEVGGIGVAVEMADFDPPKENHLPSPTDFSLRFASYVWLSSGTSPVPMCRPGAKSSILTQMARSLFRSFYTQSLPNPATPTRSPPLVSLRAALVALRPSYPHTLRPG
jgi:hypothetical protein